MQVNVVQLSAESQEPTEEAATDAVNPDHAQTIASVCDSMAGPTMLELAYQTEDVSPAQMALQSQVERQAKYHALVRRLTMAIQNSAELTEILKIAAEGTAQVLNADRGMLLRMKFWDPRHSIRSGERIPKARVIVDAKWSRQVEESASNPSTPLSPESSRNRVALGQSFWISDCGLCQHAMTIGSQPLIFHHSEQLTEQLPNPTIAPIFAPETMSALLMVPLESKNKVLGFLVVQHQQLHRWQIEEVELAELIAAQLSSAIIQTETLRQVESLVEERTAQLQQSLELQAKLYEITRKQIEKLREMNQRMDEFLSTLSHELRTPLTSMMMAIRMLREAQLPPDKQSRYLEILEKQCAQETSLINDLLALQELETKQVVMQVQPINLHQMLDDLSYAFDQRWAMKGLNLRLQLPQEPLLLYTDAASVQRVLLELLTNAGKYSDPSGAIDLSVVKVDDSQVVVTISNVGEGIAEEELPHIFEKFRRCSGMTQQAVPGTGLGLALVKSLVQHLNGSVAATSEPIPGKSICETIFTVTLPIYLDTVKS